jgi:hypothetical protein
MTMRRFSESVSEKTGKSAWRVVNTRSGGGEKRVRAVGPADREMPARRAEGDGVVTVGVKEVENQA